MKLRPLLFALLALLLAAGTAWLLTPPGHASSNHGSPNAPRHARDGPDPTAAQADVADPPAAGGPNYAITWSSVDGNGATLSRGNRYALAGTSGQPDAGVLTGQGGFTLTGGFWAAVGLRPPTATIDRIEPDPARQGRDLVYFRGTGQDNDEGGASISAYLWTSSLDGQLSIQEDFTRPAAELSAGSHTITFEVRDNEGDWSARDTATLTVLPAELFLPMILK